MTNREVFFAVFGFEPMDSMCDALPNGCGNCPAADGRKCRDEEIDTWSAWGDMKFKRIECEEEE